MKNLKKLLLTVGFCGALAVTIVSCDRDEYNWPNDNSVAGTYTVSAFNVPVAVDLNGDGTSSTNLAGESACYAGTYIRLNSNYTYAMRDIVFDADAGNVCDTVFSTGTWRKTDAILTTISSEALAGGAPVETEYNFSAGAGTLSKVVVNGNYPTSDGEGGFYSVSGDLNITYTKSN